jgi:hypothetical protein
VTGTGQDPRIEVPAVVRNKARAVGAEDWLERLPALVSGLEADWSIAVGHPYEGRRRSTMPWPVLGGGGRRTATKGPCWSTATCTS